MKKILIKKNLYHYSVAACLGAMAEWADSKTKMHSYIARKRNPEGFNTEVGFVHFREDNVRGRPVVYIAQAGVTKIGARIGRRLMECVFSHYPANTEFYILTRVFNTKAKDLYGKRFKFAPIELDEIESLGYDNRYCGFKGKNDEAMIQNISSRIQRLVSKERKHDSIQGLSRADLLKQTIGSLEGSLPDVIYLAGGGEVSRYSNNGEEDPAKKGKPGGPK